MLSTVCISLNLKAQTTISLDKTIEQAIENDDWFNQSKLQQNALLAQSEGADSAENTLFSLQMVNLPTDGFALDQEPMTQLKLGVSQQFSRGDSRAIKQNQLSTLASRFPYQRQDRAAQVTLTASKLYLNAYRAQQNISLLESDRNLLEQLSGNVNASYASGLGNTKQQDLVGAELAISKLDDQLIRLRADKYSALSRLLQWTAIDKGIESAYQKPESVILKTPIIAELSAQTVNLLAPSNFQLLMTQLADHPAVMSLEQKVQAGIQAIDLAEQDYAPQWGVNASYAYRADDPIGTNRADFFSVGVTLSLPLFNQTKLDSDVKSARLLAEANKTEKRLLMRDMYSQISASYNQLKQAKKRLDLYQNQIIKQMHQQTQASLNAYTNNKGEFADVMRAQIEESNARIEEINIAVAKMRLLTELNYFFPATQHHQYSFHKEALSR
jgi:outer membrane protein TolC